MENLSPELKTAIDICKEASPKCATILTEMALGEREIDRELRLVCVEVIKLASGKTLQMKGRPPESVPASYGDLFSTLKDDENGTSE